LYYEKNHKNYELENKLHTKQEKVLDFTENKKDFISDMMKNTDQ
ncbi:7194_t:CDS:1, partial [Gigaspora margarita]